jgi:linoleoyl-CoA desaturase
VSFDNGGAFMVDTRREVEAYLRSGRTRLSGRLHLYAKSVAAFTLWAGCWTTIVLGRPGAAAGIVALVGLLAAMILIGFCVQHDANHGAYFATRRRNHLLGWLTTDVLLGFSSYVWRVKHNVAHHTYTNVDGWDDDVAQTPFARFMPSQPPKPWYRLQHVYVWLLYGVMVLRAHSIADLAALIRGRIGHVSLHRPRGWDLAGLVGGKAMFLGWAIVAPLLVYPWWIVLAGYTSSAMLGSLVIATTFQLAHCVEEADFTPVGGARGRDDRRLLPAEPRPDLAARGSQLPDRAPPLPAGAAHALSADRRDRSPACGRARCPLHGSALASRRARLAPAPRPHARPDGPGRGDRDGLMRAAVTGPPLW